MNDYVCKIASRDELIRRWDYLIKIHPGNDLWVKFRDNAIKKFDDGSTISYFGFLKDKIICEITAYIKSSAFIENISDFNGLLNDKMAYLAAFRTDKEYEGNGYFSVLYRFVEDDLMDKGYTELCLGVEPEAVRNIEIYFHLGYTEYIKTVCEQSPNGNEYINFYKKILKN